MKTGQNDLHVHTLTFTSLKSGNEGRYTCAVTFHDDEMKQLETEVYSIGGTSSLLVMFNDLILLTMTTDLSSHFRVNFKRDLVNSHFVLTNSVSYPYRVQFFRGRVSNLNQSDARKKCVWLLIG